MNQKGNFLEIERENNRKWLRYLLWRAMEGVVREVEGQ